MMLLDTHAWLWWVDSVPGLLSPTVIEQLESAQTRVGVASEAPPYAKSAPKAGEGEPHASPENQAGQ